MYVASLILGLLSFIFCWIPGIGIVLSIVALVISIVAVCKKDSEKSGRGMSIAGLILSTLSIIVSIFMIIGIIIFANFATSMSKDILSEFKDSNFGRYLEAEVKLMEKYAEVELKNKDRMYTGYIDKYTDEYVEKGLGIEIDDYYEEYMEVNGYDVDIYVNVKGNPIIEN